MCKESYNVGSDQDVELQMMRMKMSAIDKQQDDVHKLIQQQYWRMIKFADSYREEEIDVLHKRVIARTEENIKMAEKLMNYKSKVSTVEIQLRRYTVKKIYKIMYWTFIDVEVM